MKHDDKENVSFEELSVSNMLQTEALLRILQRKGILTMDEFLDEIRIMREEHANLTGKDLDKLSDPEHKVN